MKYLVNHTDVMAMREVLNITLKARGLQALDEIILLSQSINIDNQAESGVIELTPEQVTVLIDAMDTTLRVKGMEVAYGILKLRNLLSNPLSENSEVAKHRIGHCAVFPKSRVRTSLLTHPAHFRAKV